MKIKKVRTGLRSCRDSGGGIRAVQLTLCAVLLAAAAGAQPSDDWTISTFAGTWEVGDGGSATAAGLTYPRGVAADGLGNVYIAGGINNRIRRVNPSGAITTIAGTGERGFGGDGGPATQAQLANPGGVAVDVVGNVYIADSSNRRIRKVDSSGIISTIAGTGEQGFGGDGGPAVEAQLYSPTGVAVDGAGNVYIAGNHRIRRVDPSGIISTIAGTGERGFSGDDGPAVEALLYFPSGVAVDGLGNVYISDRLNFRIRMVDSSGIISTIAGTGERGFGGDGGPATAARLYLPDGVATDSGGSLYIADRGNHRIRRVDPSGTITTIAGTGERGFGGDGGPATAAWLHSPDGVATDGAGNLFIADMSNHRIRRVDSSGTITTVAGTGEFGDGGPATQAQLTYLDDVTVDGLGNVYIADMNNNRIRRVDSTGTITTIAGTGERGFGGDGGPATQAQLANPGGVAVDGLGNVYISDGLNFRIRRVDSTGIITTIAGTGELGFGGDGGPATAARLYTPAGVAIDSGGSLYIADWGNHRIRRVDPSGTITTIAGTGERGFDGDGGPATAARLSYPDGVALDSVGNVYIADSSNNRIRKVDPSGTITTIAGTGERGFGGDGGPATAARLSYPNGVALDSVGNVYIADTVNDRVRKVNSSGVISTIAGTGERGFGGDGGPAIQAQLYSPRGVAVDGAGNVYIAGWFNRRIRVLTQLTDSGGEQAPLLEGIRDLLPF